MNTHFHEQVRINRKFRKLSYFGNQFTGFWQFSVLVIASKYVPCRGMGAISQFLYDFFHYPTHKLLDLDQDQDLMTF